MLNEIPQPLGKLQGKVTVIIGGTTHFWFPKEMSYYELVGLAAPRRISHPGCELARVACAKVRQDEQEPAR
jgi:hypothetical protein